MTPLGLYKLYIDNYEYIFVTLEEACEHFIKVLNAMNLLWFYDKGIFQETSSFNWKPKIKIYLLEIKHPKVTFKIHYKGKVALLPELVMYYLTKYAKKAGI